MPSEAKLFGTVSAGFDRISMKLIRSVSRRLQRLETRVAAVVAEDLFSARIRLVHPGKGLRECCCSNRASLL
jgi:hypothetical protein